MRAWLAVLVVLALAPLTHATGQGPILRSGSYDAGDSLSYDFGVDECERTVLARIFTLNWPSTNADGQCVTMPAGYGGHAITLTVGGAQAPSAAHACFYTQAGSFMGCSATQVPAGAPGVFAVTSPDGVLVTWSIRIAGS